MSLYKPPQPLLFFTEHYAESFHICNVFVVPIPPSAEGFPVSQGMALAVKNHTNKKALQSCPAGQLPKRLLREVDPLFTGSNTRSEERRVGKECRYSWHRYE